MKKVKKDHPVIGDKIIFEGRIDHITRRSRKMTLPGHEKDPDTAIVSVRMPTNSIIDVTVKLTVPFCHIVKKRNRYIVEG